MARTTLDIDESVLRDLKRLQRKQGKSLGRLVSDLLAETLGRNQRDEPPVPFVWHSQRMGALVDLDNKAAVQAILDRDVIEKLRR